MSGDGQAIHTNYPVIPHELVHVFQFAKGLGPVPWTEGMAVALSGMRETPDAAHRWSTWDFRPTTPLPGYLGEVQQPYDGMTANDTPDHRTRIYAVPIHRFAAYILGLDSDPAYDLSGAGERWPGVRPSQLMSWADALPRNPRLVYVVCASFIRYLIATRGLSQMVRVFGRLSSSSFTVIFLQQVEGALRFGHFEVDLKVAGLEHATYGSVDFRWQVLSAGAAGLDVTVDAFSGTPSWTSVLVGVGATVGRDSRYLGWAAGLQAGLAASPAPNQRPMGPNALLSVTAAAWFRPVSPEAGVSRGWEGS